MFKFIPWSKLSLANLTVITVFKSVHNHSKKSLDFASLHLAVWHSPNPIAIICISSNKFVSMHLNVNLTFSHFFRSFKVISLFSYQSALLSVLSSSFHIISKHSSPVKNFLHLFYFVLSNSFATACLYYHRVRHLSTTFLNADVIPQPVIHQRQHGDSLKEAKQHAECAVEASEDRNMIDDA